MLDFSGAGDFQKNSSGYSCYDSHIGKLWTHFSDWGEVAFFTVCYMSRRGLCWFAEAERCEGRIGGKKVRSPRENRENNLDTFGTPYHPWPYVQRTHA